MRKLNERIGSFFARLISIRVSARTRSRRPQINAQF